MTDNYYEPHVVPDPSRPYIFHSCENSRGCLPHWHENIEILYFHTSGTVIRDRTEYPVKAGDMAIFGSNTLHAVPIRDNNSYDCLIIDGKFCSENDVEISSLEFSCVITDVHAAALFRDAVDEIYAFDPAEPSCFSAAGAKASILTLTVYLCRKYSRISADSRERCDTVKRAIGYINSHLSKPMTVDEISGYVTVSKYYFCREFRRETGYTVVRYINNLRCREAERMLLSSESTVGEIACECGYDNLSYFTRTFRSIIGKSPSETRAGRR